MSDSSAVVTDVVRQKLKSVNKYSFKAPPVLGHSELTAIPEARSSSAMPRVHMDIPYLAMVYAAIHIGHVSIYCTGFTYIMLYMSSIPSQLTEMSFQQIKSVRFLK
jgi:hypothetical protein